MKKVILLLAAFIVASPASALEPIPGSLTYGGGPRTKLLKSPIGSSLSHMFYMGGQLYVESYILLPDRSLKLVSRSRGRDR
jgi:hypothetical protein